MASRNIKSLTNHNLYNKASMAGGSMHTAETRGREGGSMRASSAFIASISIRLLQLRLVGAQHEYTHTVYVETIAHDALSQVCASHYGRPRDTLSRIQLATGSMGSVDMVELAQPGR